VLPDAAATLNQRVISRQGVVRYRYAAADHYRPRGPLPQRREGALKLIKTCCLSALAFSGADLPHDPIAVIDSGVSRIAVLAHGAGRSRRHP